MNVWMLLLEVLGWVLLAILAMVIILVVIGIGVASGRVIKKAVKKLSRHEDISDTKVKALGAEYASSTYGGSLFPNEADVFQHGVNFALIAKRGQHADRV